MNRQRFIKVVSIFLAVLMLLSTATVLFQILM